MSGAARIHFLKKDGKRSTVSLDTILSKMILELGHKDIGIWVQQTYDRIVEEIEEGKRAPLDKSLSGEIQREALLEFRRALHRQQEVIQKKEEQRQASSETVPLVKHIIHAFENAARKGHLAGYGTFAKLDFLRKELKSSAEHFRLHGWNVEDKKNSFTS